MRGHVGGAHGLGTSDVLRLAEENKSIIFLIFSGVGNCTLSSCKMSMEMSSQALNMPSVFSHLDIIT